MGVVVAIQVSADKAAALAPAESAQLVAGHGIVGDRYFNKSGTFSKKRGEDRQITLIEEEALAAALSDYGVVVTGPDSRRNVVTRGVALNHLVGKMFRVGACVLEGVELCEPCGHLAKLTGNDRVRAALVHRGGLRARICEGGTVRVGDEIVLG
ncbi:MAG TPA: MOSC domain-containing protein [Myxococcota bacterium]|jgi:MOSC domain-containing protein YiiM